MMRSASSNSDTFDRWLISPVWIMKAGFCGSALTLPMASSRVPSAFGLAGLSKPTWLSLICRKVRPLASCACASPMMPSECGTPPEMVHSTPVPTQVMHSSTLRRLIPSSRSNSLITHLLYANAHEAHAALGDEIRHGGCLFPGENDFYGWGGSDAAIPTVLLSAPPGAPATRSTCCNLLPQPWHR